ncbi:UNVERIFIED_CONTAM: hypothetical protein Slati_0211600 [Sesamum latifolium]|uniref:Retroviral polymerase SH3-like domain-containing protein n=1 Tax=Sesamum latifolium TaxID=2727402 RepID=A0AAW2YBM0_9LAMI
MVHINFSEVEEIAGNLTFVNSGSWIVDTGATRHLQPHVASHERLAVGKLGGKLYILDTNSFVIHPTKIHSVLLSTSNVVDSNRNDSIWHQRLGHSLIKPLYSHLKVFGCLCYANNTDPRKTKLSLRASKCVFIGYAPGQKGYKIFDLSSQSCFISRDVLFYESIIPFSSTDLATPSCCPISLVHHFIDDAYVPPQSQNSEPLLASPLPAPLAHSLVTSSPASPVSSFDPSPPEPFIVQSRSYTKAFVSHLVTS